VKICIYGAGSVGGYLGGRLAAGGFDVSLVARGRHLEAIRQDGLTVNQQGEAITVRPAASDDPASFGPQDAVICTVKAHGLTEAARGMAPLLGPGTSVIFAMNGVPWWYFHALPGPHEGRTIDRLDPQGAIRSIIGPERAIGCVVHIGAEVTSPGTVTVTGRERFELGEPDGSLSPRLTRLMAAFEAAGITAVAHENIRDYVWSKLLGNITSNPLSALTRATMGQLYDDDILRNYMRRMMEEAEAVATALGASLPLSIDKRLEIGPRLKGFKTSTLQDLLAGRPLEIEPIVGAVTELGDLTGVDTPSIDLIYALLKRLAINEGLYPAG
jgi:2-dehydropantoate 2-reductase